LEQVEVVFYSVENGPRSWALTDEDGHFETMTDGIQKAPARKGAPVGKYRVALVDRRNQILAEERMRPAMPRRPGPLDPRQFEDPALPPEQRKNAPRSEIRVPAQYNQLNTPFGDIEVKPGKNWFDLDVK
jgi:hypothetical protein